MAARDFTYRWGNFERTQVVRSDGTRIPADPRNMDYADILEAIKRAEIDITLFSNPPPPPRTKTQLIEELLGTVGVTLQDLNDALGR